MKKTNTRKIGDSLEKWLVSYLEEVDSTTKQTNNSGATSNNGDILNKNFIIEAKHRNTKNLTIQEKVWKKLNKQIKVGSQKIPLLVMRNIENETFAILNFRDFLQILKDRK